MVSSVLEDNKLFCFLVVKEGRLRHRRPLPPFLHRRQHRRFSSISSSSARYAMFIQGDNLNFDRTRNLVSRALSVRVVMVLIEPPPSSPCRTAVTASLPPSLPTLLLFVACCTLTVFVLGMPEVPGFVTASNKCCCRCCCCCSPCALLPLVSV